MEKLRNLKRYLKPWDFILIITLFICSFLPLILFTINQNQLSHTETVNTAIISVNGEKIKSFTLNDPAQKLSYRYKNSDGEYNLIIVKGNKIRISDADCTDQLCVRMGWISNAGDTIVCLPHKLSIEIISSDKNQPGGMIY